MASGARPSDSKLTGLVSTLRCAQLFSGLSAEDLATLAAFAVVVRLEKDQVLFREGEPARGCFLVQAGAVTVFRLSPGGKERVIYVFRTGESLAEAALASPTGYPANARALEPSTVLMLPKGPLLELIGKRPDLAMRMLGAMSSHLRVLVGMIEDLTLKDVETRLLHWLVRRLGSAKAGRIDLPGTKRALAAELGTSGETLSRTLATLRERGWLSVSGRTLTVRDRAAVEARLRRNLGES